MNRRLAIAAVAALIMAAGSSAAATAGPSPSYSVVACHSPGDTTVQWSGFHPKQIALHWSLSTYGDFGTGNAYVSTKGGVKSPVTVATETLSYFPDTVTVAFFYGSNSTTPFTVTAPCA